MDILEDKNFVKELNIALKNGAVIAFVTDTVWGVGCLPQSEKGVENIYALKNRDTSKPLILMSDSVENLKPYVKNIPSMAQGLIDKYFPGAITLVLEKSENTPFFITSQKSTVGIRVPANVFFNKLCKVIDGNVLATTSANLSSQPASKTYDETKKSIGSMVYFVFEDYGAEAKGLESTVVLAIEEEVKVLRQGAINIL